MRIGCFTRNNELDISCYPAPPGDRVGGVFDEWFGRSLSAVGSDRSLSVRGCGLIAADYPEALRTQRGVHKAEFCCLSTATPTSSDHSSKIVYRRVV